MKGQIVFSVQISVSDSEESSVSDFPVGGFLSLRLFQDCASVFSGRILRFLSPSENTTYELLQKEILEPALLPLFMSVC